MTTLAALRIAIESGDVAKATVELDKLTAAGGRATKASDVLASAQAKLGQAMAAVGVSLAAGEVIKLIDSYTKYTAQIKLASASQAEYRQGLEEVRRIANSAQAGLAQIGTLYARVSNSVRDLGASQAAVSQITEVTALALKVSGATAGESASAILQLSQAFGSGVLRGEEFNAVNEAAPRLMKALADGLNVPVGALRKMATEGKLTSDVLATVLPKSLETLRGEAAQVQTIAGAFEVLKNKVMEFIGTQAQASGTVKTLTDAISLVADNINVLTAAATGLAAAKMASTILAAGAGAVTYASNALSASAAVAALRDSTIKNAVAQEVSTSATLANVTATQAAIVAARGDAVATLARANATVASSQAALAAASAAGAQSAALAVLRGATATLTASEQARTVALAELAALGRAQAAVTAQLTAANLAQAASQAAVATAMAGTAATAGLLTRALGFIGGPVGAIATLLGLGVTAWQLWGSAAADSERKATGEVKSSTEEITADIQKQIDKLKERNDLAGKPPPKPPAEANAADKGVDAALDKLTRFKAGTYLGDVKDEQTRIAVLVQLSAEYGRAYSLAQQFNRETSRKIDIDNAKAFTDEMKKFGPPIDKAIEKIKELKERFGARLTPADEKAIIEHFVKPGAAGENAAKRASDAYADLNGALDARIEKLKAELSQTVPLTDAQKLELELAKERTKILREHGPLGLAEIDRKAREAVATQKLIDVREQDKASVAAQFASAIALQEAREKSVDALLAEAEAADAQVKAMKDETEAIGLTGVALLNLTNRRTDDLIMALKVKATTVETTQEVGAINRQIAALERLKQARADNLLKQSSVDAEAAMAEQFNKIADEGKRAADQINQSLTDSLFRAAESGKGAFKALADAAKGYFYNLILRPTVQAALQPVGNMVSQTASGIMGGGGGPMNLLGSGGLSGAYSSFATSSAGTFLGLSEFNASAELIGVAATELTTFGSALGSAISGLAAAAPYLAVAALIYQALAQDAGGPKGGGSYSTTGERLFTPETEDAMVAKIGAGVGTAITGLLKDFGGDASRLEYGIGFDTDPQGTADSRISSFLRDAGGRNVLDNVAGRGVGRDSAALQSELTVETKRLMLAALQATDLEHGFTDIFKRLDVATATSAQIDALVQAATQLRQLGEAAGQLPGVLGSIAELSATARESLVGFAGGMEALTSNMASYFQNFYSPEERLAQAGVNLGTAFAKVGLSFDALVADSDGPSRAFRDIVEGINTTTDAGLQQLAAVIALNPQLRAWIDATDEAKEKLTTATAALNAAGIAVGELGLAAATALAKSQLGELKTVAEGLGTEADDIRAQMSGLTAEFGDLAPAAETVSQALSRTTGELEALEQGLDQALGNLAETALEKLNRLINERSGLQGAQTTLRDQIDEARLTALSKPDQVEALRGRETSLRAQLDSAPAGQQPALIAQLANTIIRRIRLAAENQADGVNGGVEKASKANDLRIAGLEDELDLMDTRRTALEKELTAARQLVDLTDRLRDAVLGFRIGDLSPLGPATQLQTASGSFEQTLAGAQGGDQKALGKLPGIAQSYLAEAQGFYGNTKAYASIFESVTSALDKVGAGTGPARSEESLSTLVEQNKIDTQTLKDQLTSLKNLEFDTVDIANTSAEEALALGGLDTSVTGYLALVQTSIDAQVLAVAEQITELRAIKTAMNDRLHQAEVQWVNLDGRLTALTTSLDSNERQQRLLEQAVPT